MSQLIILTIIFQGFCFYHIYSRKNEPYWYFIIFLFPLLGGLAYFIYHYYFKGDMEMASEGIANTVVQPSELEKLTIEAEFADTITNKIRLGDAHMESKNFEKAIEIYRSCMEGIYKDDEELNKKLLQAHYSNEDYLSTMMLGNKLNTEKYFQNSPEKIAYAWSYFELHDDDKAKEIFEEMNIHNTNYEHRKEFAKFLVETNQPEAAKILLNEMKEEMSNMDEFELKIFKDQIADIQKMSKEMKG